MCKKCFLVMLIIAALVLLIGIVPASASPDESSGIVHVVSQGETLYSISRRYGVDMWAIARANGITNPSRIFVGQRLVIPTSQPVGVVHIVQRGEVLTQIALRYGVDVWAIARANGISNLNHIYVGQRLTIPGAAPPVKQPSQPKPSVPTSLPGPWSGEYFDNVGLTESPYVTREDATIDFNWESGPPAGGMPVNAFSVRWTGTFYFDAGTYRFYTRIDDGVRVYVDDERIIDGWRDGGFRLYTAQKSLEAGDHTVKVEYYDRIQVARAHFWWKQISSAVPTATPKPEATATPKPEATATPKPGSTGTLPPTGSGWLAEFYNNETLTGDPVVTRYDNWIGFDWGNDNPADGVPGDHFSVRWTSKVQLQTDHYRFCLMSDDGARIWVGEDLVLDNWHADNGKTTYCNEYWAETGTYEVTVEHYEHEGRASIYVWWEPH